MVSPILQFFLDSEVKARGITFDAPRPGDAGFDLRASQDMIIETGAQALVPTGLRVAIPQGWVGIVKDRSSMALKRIYSHAGVIDASYRGEVKIVLSNHGQENYHIEAGSKVAQMIVIPCCTEVSEASGPETLGSTDRGEGGFGSTGVR